MPGNVITFTKLIRAEDVNLFLNGEKLGKTDPTAAALHLGIPVRLDQLCGSGRRPVQLEEDKKFLPAILKQVRDRANEIISIENLILSMLLNY